MPTAAQAIPPSTPGQRHVVPAASDAGEQQRAEREGRPPRGPASRDRPRAERGRSAARRAPAGSRAPRRPAGTARPAGTRASCDRSAARRFRRPAPRRRGRAGTAGCRRQRQSRCPGRCRRRGARSASVPGGPAAAPGRVRRRDDSAEGPMSRGSGPERPASRRRSTTRDIERYASLFAAAHERDAVLGDAGPDGAHRARRCDLARRRAPRHLHVPPGLVRVADGHCRRPVVRARAPVRADRGAGGGQDVHPAGDGGRGDGGRPGRDSRHHRRSAGDRPGVQDAARPRRHRHHRGADIPGSGPDVLRLPGGGRPGGDGSRRDADRRAPRDARGNSSAPGGGRSSSTPFRTSTIRPGSRWRSSAGTSSWHSPPSTSCSCWRTTPTGCCATRATPCRRSARSTRISSSTPARSPRSSRPACASAGPSRPPRCWPR